MFAYFIGGPWDLTKRAMKPSELGVALFQAPVPKDMATFQKADESHQRLSIIRHEYRRYFTQGEAAIYIYEGIR